MAAESAQEFRCQYCGYSSSSDWGGFCPDCGFQMPDRDGSPTLEEFDRIGRELRQIPGHRWFSLVKSAGVFMAIYALLTGVLFTSYCATALIPGTPVNLPNLVWLAAGAPIFLYLGYLGSDFAADA